jgi:hypothetical protein
MLKFYSLHRLPPTTKIPVYTGYFIYQLTEQNLHLLEHPVMIGVLRIVTEETHYINLLHLSVLVSTEEV